MHTAYRFDVGEPKVASISILGDVYRAALPYLKENY